MRNIFIICCLLLHVLSCAYVFHSRIVKSNAGELRLQGLTKLNGFKPGWTNRPNFVIIDETDQPPRERRSRGGGGSGKPFVIPQIFKPLSIGNMTLVQFSKKYHFCLPYLGDFAVRCGCTVPVDADVPIDTIMDEDMMNELKGLIGMDPSNLNFMYSDSPSLRSLTLEWGVSYPEMVRLCDRCNVPMPFNLDTIPNEQNIKYLKRLLDSDRGVKPVKEEDDDDFFDPEETIKRDTSPAPPTSPSSNQKEGTINDELSETDEEEFQDQFRMLFGEMHPMGDRSMFFDGAPKPEEIIFETDDSVD